jgi:hypothetical protein
MFDVRRYRVRVPALVILAAAALLAQQTADAQQPRPLTVDALYHPEKKVEFSVPRTTLTWLDDDYYVVQGGRAATSAGKGEKADAAQPYRIEKVHAVTGKTEPWFDASKLTAAIARVPGVTADDAKYIAKPRLSHFNAARTGILITTASRASRTPRAARKKPPSARTARWSRSSATTICT